MNLKVHTAMCSGCREFGRQLGSLRTLIQEEKTLGLRPVKNNFCSCKKSVGRCDLLYVRQNRC